MHIEQKALYRISKLAIQYQVNAMRIQIEFSQMSTHLRGFLSFSSFLHHFVSAKLATTSSMRVKETPQVDFKGKSCIHRARNYTHRGTQFTI